MRTLRSVMLYVCTVGCALMFKSCELSHSSSLIPRVVVTSPVARPSVAPGLLEANKNEAEVLKNIRAALAANEAVRIAYQAICIPEEVRSNTFQHIQFPNVVAHVSSVGLTGLAAIRDVFQGDRNVVVTAGSDNIVRVRMGNPSDDLLKTRISTVAFTREEQYDPNEAMAAIFHAREVIAAYGRWKIQPILRVGDYVLRSPREGAPHLPPSIGDETLDQALDAVAVTFGEITVYGACTRPRLFDVNIFPLHE